MVADLGQVFDDLVRLEIELWEALERRLRTRLDLPLGSFQVLRIVARVPDCRVHDIARELAITVGGTSKAVDRVEAAGHCRRRANPGDRRSSIVELTEAGIALLAEGDAIFRAELADRLGVLAEEELSAFTTTLARLRAAGHALTEGNTP